jgi:hypothetical protein
MPVIAKASNFPAKSIGSNLTLYNVLAMILLRHLYCSSKHASSNAPALASTQQISIIKAALRPPDIPSGFRRSQISTMFAPWHHKSNSEQTYRLFAKLNLPSNYWKVACAVLEYRRDSLRILSYRPLCRPKHLVSGTN